MIRPASGPSIVVSDHKRLEILYNISQAINSIFDIKELAKKVADEVFGVIRADRFLLMLKDERTSEFIPQIAIGRDEKEAELTVSRTMIERVTTEGVSILVRDTYKDSFFREAQSLISKNICSILCAPLWSKEGIIGLIYVDSGTREKNFSEDELSLFTAIGNQVAAAFQNIRMQEKLWKKKRIERELEIAAEIQQSFLPRSFPSCAGYGFGIESIPAQNVGGDFYDCFSISAEKIGLVVGDVSGKGVPAALYMARLISEFKIMSMNFTGSALVMSEMNKRFREIAIGGNFVSATYLVLDINSGTINYTMAGCHPILFYNNKKDMIMEIETCGGPILGIGEGVFKEESLIFGSGDMAILYTDGVIEAKNSAREEFGISKLKDTVIKFKNFKADEIAEKVVEAVFEFSEKRELSDDLTLLVLKKG
jgi:sigma-B regulation protein RsbU (phosphoserine phosphatase)